MEAIERWDLTDFHLWGAYKDEFRDFTEDHFKAVRKIELAGLRACLRRRGVWVQIDGRISAAKALTNTLEEEYQTQWSTEEVLNVYMREEFVSKELSEFVAKIHTSKISPPVPSSDQPAASSSETSSVPSSKNLPVLTPPTPLVIF